MQRLLAIVWLTLKASFRFRLFPILAAVLLGSVILLPLIIEDDGTARGFAQIILTYTLATITALLGLATLWLACGTLARDVEESQIQLLVVKPIARWEIWLGKWLGILVINGILLGISSAAVYGLMQYRASQLTPEEQTKLRNEIMVARAAASEPVPDYDPLVEAELRKKIEESQQKKIELTDLDYVRKQILEQMKAIDQVVPPNFRRQWTINLGLSKERAQEQPLFIRTRFNTAEYETDQTYLGLWGVGEMDSPYFYQTNLSMAAETFYEFEVPPKLVNDQGMVTVHFINRNNVAMLFPLEDGLEVLYRETGFGVNFFRGICIIFLWLAFLAALGLAAASYLSFPVAAFLALAVLIVGSCSGIITLILEQGTVWEVNQNTGLADEPALIDYVALPTFRGLLNLINMVKGFSPIDSLSTGRSITWSQLGWAVFQIGGIMCGSLGALGITLFTRRELATAQGTN